MKICILNLSGNVGKSTLAVHLFRAFNEAAKIISVESYNSSVANEMDNIEVDEISASRFKEIYREIMMSDDVIVDVGASNVSTFMAEVTRFKSSVGEFDYIIVPTVPADKQQKDTIATINWLHSSGINPERVRVVFNQFDINTHEPVENVYSQVIGYLKTDGDGTAIYEPYAVVASNEIYEMIKSSGKTITEVAKDKTDWKKAREKAKADKNMDDLERAIEGQMLHDLATTAYKNLAEVNKIILK